MLSKLKYDEKYYFLDKQFFLMIIKYRNKHNLN